MSEFALKNVSTTIPPAIELRSGDFSTADLPSAPKLHAPDSPPVEPALSLAWLPEFNARAILSGELPEPKVITALKIAFEELRLSIETFHCEQRASQPRNSSILRDEFSLTVQQCCSYPLLDASQERLLGQTIEYHRALFQFSAINVSTLRSLVCDQLSSCLAGEPMQTIRYQSQASRDNLEQKDDKLLRLAIEKAIAGGPDAIAQLAKLNLRADHFKEIYRDWNNSTDLQELSARDAYWNAFAKEHLVLCDQASRLLQNCNSRLVVSIAKRYRNRGLDMPDLFQEGSIGLTRSIERWDHNLGYRLSTYATWWIRQTITRALDNDPSTIRLPSHHKQTLMAIRNSEQALWQNQITSPDEETISQHSGIPVGEVKTLKSWGKPVSLNATVGTNSETIRAHLIPDKSVAAPDAASELSEISGKLRRAIEDLSDREREIILLRYGMGDGSFYTQEECASIMETTTERIRQAENVALKRLRANGQFMNIQSLSDAI